MTKHLTIHGTSIRDIPSLYAELNRVFMPNESWALGESLDALDDMLRGGYGAIEGREPVTLLWTDMEASRAALGSEATRAYLLRKLEQPQVYNADLIGQQLHALEQGSGQTYFEIVMEIIVGHPNIALIAN